MNLSARIPPQAVEFEETILGSMMINRESSDIVLELLSVDDFYKPCHQLIYSGLTSLLNDGESLDLLSLENYLRDKKLLDKVGGVSYISDLTRSVSSNIEYYCKIVKGKSKKRNLINICYDLIDEAYDSATDELELIETAQEKIFSLSDDDNGHLYDIADTLHAVAHRVSEIQKNGKPIGIQTGLDLDDILHGFQESKLYIIGARPSMGKTALVMTIMRLIAKGGQSSGILSLETSHESLGIRLLSQVSRLPAERITSGKMTNDELNQFLDACAHLSNYSIYIEDSAGLTSNMVRSKCRLMAKKGVDIIFIDFLQLIIDTGRSRHEEIGRITKTCKAISKELNIPIVILSQLSRKVEERKDKQPQLADLRESGSIEEDADVILLLYRPEYYGIDHYPTGESTAGIAEVIIAKNKDGKTGIKKQLFEASTMTFKNIDSTKHG